MAGHRKWRRWAAGLATTAGMAVLAPAASATITPAVTLDQGAGTTAAASQDLGVDVNFAPSAGDSPKALTVGLPSGLFINAATGGIACLQSATPSPSCQVGTGTLTLQPLIAGLPAGPTTSEQVTFDLVKPPASGDLAGLAIVSSGSQVGAAADVALRPASDPQGIGVNIAFADLSATLGSSASLQEIAARFTSVRYPSSCPATAANLTVSATSEQQSSTVRTATAPLTVTGCATAPFAPGLTTTATRDAADAGVQVTSDVTQAANELTASSVALSFPSSTLEPNLGVLSLRCDQPASGTCTPVGSAMATSPIYPTALSGSAYLTGSASAPTLSIVFGAPFALTIVGSANVGSGSITFTHVPDIPLTDFTVALNGGSQGVFASNCADPTGTAAATIVSQNGDRTAAPQSTFTVANCPASTGPPAGTGTPTPSGPSIVGAHMGRLLDGHPTLAFTAKAAAGGPGLRALTFRPPAGVSFVRHRRHHKLVFSGVTVRGAKVKSQRLAGGTLFIVLRSAASSVTVNAGTSALKESAGLLSKARHGKVNSLGLTVVTVDAKGKRSTLRTTITDLGLST